MKCPDCESNATFGTKTKGKFVTIKIKCTNCNRKVIRTGRRDNFNYLRNVATAAWCDTINCGINGNDFD